jgi:putative nucleotidyltransferase with HDIG domain
MDLFRGFGKRNAGKGDVHSRHNYVDHSRRFLEWVDSLGFDDTFTGRLVSRLDRRFNLRRLGLIFFYCLGLSFLVFFDFDYVYNVDVGSVATLDFKSPISFQIVDEGATEDKRAEAEKSVPPVFDYDPNVYEGMYNNIYKAFRTLRKEVRAVHWPESDVKREEKIKELLSLRPEFEANLGRKISDRLFEWLIENEFSARVENILIRALVNWSSQRIADIPSNLPASADSTLILRMIENGKVTDESIIKHDEIVDVNKTSEFQLDTIRGVETLSKRDRRTILDLAHALLTANVSFNRQETTQRRSKAREAVLPVQISIKKNQTIINSGTVVRPIHVTLLNEIRSLKADRRTDFIAFVAALLFMSMILVFFSYLRRFSTSRLKIGSKDITVMGLVTVAVVLITKIFLFMTDAAFLSRFGTVIPSGFFLFAAPVAAGPMLVGLLITSGEVVWLFTVFLTVVLTVMVDMNFAFAIVSMVGGVAAARGVFACKKRNDIYWAGVRTGLVNALAITLMLLVEKLGDGDVLYNVLWIAPAGFVGGILASMVAMTLVPLLESMFNYVTDVKLLELSSLNHPLMKEMIVKAPGTYHHSLVVGSMCEAGAEEIGANALLAKVMAYYHDIGKMSHAQYFIENQKPGYNPHDFVSPNMSKTILVAHVKDGAELGIQHKLGKPIIDGILQHHGTTLISFFYNKALESQDEDIDTIEPDDFRYPGPKPQFKEAALVMLADSIEAAARSLDEPTPARLQNIVKNIIQSKFLDGQLDECNLTLRDLSVIEIAFRRVLLGIYHQRIDYPKSTSGAASPRLGLAKNRKGHTA